MKKKIALVALLSTLFPVKETFAQDCPESFKWAVQAQESVSDSGQSISTDSNGNSYVTGNFYGTTTFGTYTLTNTGNFDVFITKLDADGNFLWATQAGGNGPDYAHGISIDASGNSYVTGRFQGTATFGSTSLTSSGGDDIFIAKLDVNGNFLWVVKAGGNLTDRGWGISTDESGNSYVTGEFGVTATFGSISLTSTGGSDTFIAKLDTNGSFLWVTKAGGTSNDRGWGISTDESGNSYVTGEFGANASFGSISLSNTSGSINLFIAKLDANGDFLWAVKAGGGSSNCGKSISTDTFGNVYVTGFFMTVVTFGSISLASAGGYDAFISKLDTNGNFLWTKRVGGSRSDYGLSICVDDNENSYVTGEFDETVTFGSTVLVAQGIQNIFIAKLDINGNFLWARQTEGSLYDRGYGISIDAFGNSYVTGEFLGNATFDTHTTIGSNIEKRMFVTKISPDFVIRTDVHTVCESLTWIDGITYTSDNNTATYTIAGGAENGCDSIIVLNLTISNTDRTISLSGMTLTANQTGATYQWIDCDNGNTPISGETAQSFEPIENGNYAVEVTINGCTKTSDCILVNSVGIKSLNQERWNVYPNPNNGVFTISSNKSFNDAEFKVYTPMGQLVYQSSENSGTTLMINLQDYPAGVYLLTVNNTSVFRIITTK